MPEGVNILHCNPRILLLWKAYKGNFNNFLFYPIPQRSGCYSLDFNK